MINAMYILVYDDKRMRKGKFKYSELTETLLIDKLCFIHARRRCVEEDEETITRLATLSFFSLLCRAWKTFSFTSADSDFHFNIMLLTGNFPSMRQLYDCSNDMPFH